MQEVRPGVWRLRAVVGYDPAGRPKQASRTVHGTRRVAQSALAHFVSEAERGNARVGCPNVEGYLESWMEHVRAHCQPDTARNYALRARRFAKELGSTRLDKLTAKQLDEVYRRFLREGMTPATIKSYHGVLSAALSQAVKWGIIVRSVAPLATLPRIEPRRMKVPSAAQIHELVVASEPDDPVLSAAIMLAALTGCRRGELMGLRWADVDRERMVLEVERAIKREETGRKLREGPTKSHQSRRISLDPVMLAVLDTHRRRAESWAAEAQVELEPDGYILTEDPTGRTPLAPDTITHRFSRLAKRLGLGPLRFHDLRHAVATTLLGAGYDLATVAGRLGHRDPVITLRVYSHALIERDRQAAITLGEIMGPPPELPPSPPETPPS
jgi:integrase